MTETLALDDALHHAADHRDEAPPTWSGCRKSQASVRCVPMPVTYGRRPRAVWRLGDQCAAGIFVGFSRIGSLGQTGPKNDCAITAANTMDPALSINRLDGKSQSRIDICGFARFSPFG
jgi:hypothetical protein